MRQFITTLAFLLGSTGLALAEDMDTISLFKGAVFYDGYQSKHFIDSVAATAPELVGDGLLHIMPYQYAVKMTDEQLDKIGSSLAADVKVKAICDNYDRLCSINLAFVTKGQDAYDPDSVQRIEIGRFITPFMNKNKQPDTCPYAFSFDYVSYILRDTKIRAEYDIWAELEIFGVPYAARTQISGCKDRNDVFAGYFDFVTSKEPAPSVSNEILVPITIRQPDWRAGDFNNYKESGCDTLGISAKTYYFDVPEDVEDAQIVLVTSNHGANSGGEEYNRRWHYIYIDGAEEPALVYKPGRQSCEPFRQYNTQKNGIYNGSFGWTTYMTDEKWQSFSNWCPGDVIDNRIISLGAVKAGKHKIKVSVPDAVFNNNEGKIPVSIFFQGLTDGKLPVTGIKNLTSVVKPYQLRIKATSGRLAIECSEGVMGVEVRDLNGKLIQQAECTKDIQLPPSAKGIHLISVEMMNGVIETQKVVLE